MVLCVFGVTWKENADLERELELCDGWPKR